MTIYFIFLSQRK